MRTFKGKAVAPPGALASGLKTFLLMEILLVVACFAAEVFCKFVLHLHAAYAYPLMVMRPFPDLFLNAGNLEYFHQAAFYTHGRGISYPAPMGLAYWMFFRYRAHPLGLFLGFVDASFVLSGVLLGKALRRRGASGVGTAGLIGVSLLLAYPVWFECKQGNMEICVWVLLTLGVWAFFKGKGYSAAACFGLAGSMKIFPFVYLGLHLAKGRFREIVFGVVVAAAGTVGSLWLTGGSVLSTWRLIGTNLAVFQQMYMLRFRPGEEGFDHSLFALCKNLTPHLPGTQAMGHLLTLYMAVVAVGGIVLYFTRIWRLPLVNQVLCLCVASILLPPVSYDYTLMHLYVPLGLLALLAQERWASGETMAGMTAALVCLAILVTPQSEFILHGERVGGQMKAVVLVVLMALGLRYPWRMDQRRETGAHKQATTGVGAEDRSCADRLMN